MFKFFIFLIFSISNIFSMFLLKNNFLTKLINKDNFKFCLVKFDYERDKKHLIELMFQNSKHLWSESAYLDQEVQDVMNLNAAKNQVEIYKELLKYTKNNKIIVKRENNETVGYVFYKEQKKILSFIYKYQYKGSIEALAVEKNSYGKKYGKELLTFAIDDLSKNKDIDYVEVLTTTKNVGLKFYCKDFEFYLAGSSYNNIFGSYTFWWKKYLRNVPLKIKFKKKLKNIFTKN